MFRRSLVDLIYPETDEQLRLYLDHYLSTFGVLVAGSIAIHESLYAYRMHGKNNHSTAAVVGGTFATSRNDWAAINRNILQLVHRDMQARRDELLCCCRRRALQSFLSSVYRRYRRYES